MLPGLLLRAKVALALSEYHAETGAYPHALAELVPAYLPEPPIDPRTAAPVVYQLCGDG